MPLIPRATLLLGLLAGCASSEAVRDEATPELDSDREQDFVEQTSRFYLEVEPLAETLSGVRVPPRTFGPFTEGNSFTLDLVESIAVSGTLTGVRVTPWFGALPLEQVEVEAAVHIDRVDGQRAYRTRTEPDSSFAFRLVPDTYRLTIVPDDPRLPIRSQVALWLEDTELDLTIGPGVPLWGQVVDALGAGQVGVSVWASDAYGTQSAAAATDEQGWFELRVEPGTWSLNTSGGVDGRGPSLFADNVQVGETGERVDFVFAESERARVDGRVLGADGQPIEALAVRFTSRALLGYAPDEASYRVEALTDSRGFFSSQLPAGAYDVEVRPNEEIEASPILLSSVPLLEDADLGNFRLPPLATVSATVLDPTEQPLVGAFVQCAEDGALQRRWDAFTDNAGVFALSLPAFALICTVHPPTDAVDLPLTRVLTTGDRFPDVVRVRPGASIGGTVSVGGAPLQDIETPVLVRVVDLDGVTRGVATANPRTGRFDVSVSWSP